MGAQQQWQFCQNCHELFFDGFPEKGRCPAGGGHAAAGFNFVLPHDIPETPFSQGAWRFCGKCSAMYFDGNPSKGVCPAGGGHAAAGFNFILPHSLPEPPDAQGGWRFCGKCSTMYFDGFPEKGVCQAGGGHVPEGLGFLLAHDLQAVLEFHFEPIVFGGGVPVGGAAHLTLGQNGAYHFRGHFHDSGAVGFDVALFWAVKDFQDRVYTFENAGSVGGTFTAGSRDHDFDVNSFDARIADNWANIGARPMAHAQAKVDIDLGALRDSVMEVVGTVVEVAAIVA